MRITYRAAPGDDAEIAYFGLALKDGEPVEVAADHPALEKGRGNPTLEVDEAETPVRRGPGRPPAIKPDPIDPA